jgi:hypothetical protein
MKHTVISLSFLLCLGGCYRHADGKETEDAAGNAEEPVATSDESESEGAPPDGTASAGSDTIAALIDSSDSDTGSMAGDPDAGTHSETGLPLVDCCLGATIAWGTDCGMDHIDATFLLPSCTSDIDEPTGAICLAELPACPDDDLVDASDLNRLLAAPDLLDALDGEVSSFGAPRGTYFFIRLTFEDDEDPRLITVGAPCGDDTADCVPIPKSVAALKSLLDTIVENQSTYNVHRNESYSFECAYHLW